QTAAKTPEITAELAPPRKSTPRATTPAAPRTAEAAAPAAAPQGTGTGPAMLTVFSRIPLDVYFEGRRIGTTDDGQLLVPAGAHKFELVSRRYGYRGDLTLSLQAGQIVTHTVSLPSGVLRVRGAAGTEVWVEGEHMGALPLGDVSVPIGTREVVFRHPQQGERRQMIEVGAATPAEVTATFGATPAAPAPEAAAVPQPSAPPPAQTAPQSPPRLAPLSQARPRANVQ
ncbi:MAG TPA: hypothetical protein VFO31_03210, partial [Vicinamibacterales bacterium]|nr:hypothetical protein [Vicinamibacterales bacterium]